MLGGASGQAQPVHLNASHPDLAWEKERALQVGWSKAEGQCCGDPVDHRPIVGQMRWCPFKKLRPTQGVKKQPGPGPSAASFNSLETHLQSQGKKET